MSSIDITKARNAVVIYGGISKLNGMYIDTIPNNSIEVAEELLNRANTLYPVRLKDRFFNHEVNELKRKLGK